MARSDKVSLTVNLPYSSWEEIRGVSMGGRAVRVTDPKEIDRVGQLMLRKFPQIPQYASTGLQGMVLFRITREIISVLDYRKGFGHTEVVSALGVSQAQLRSVELRRERYGTCAT